IQHVRNRRMAVPRRMRDSGDLTFPAGSVTLVSAALAASGRTASSDSIRPMLRYAASEAARYDPVVDAADEPADAVAEHERVDEADEASHERHAVAREVRRQQREVCSHPRPALQHQD